MIHKGSIVGNGGGPDRIHSSVVNERFHLHTGVSSTVAVTSFPGDTSIEVEDATGFVVKDALQINNGRKETTFPTMPLAPVGDVLGLDRPLDFAYSIGDIVDVVHIDLSTTAGSLAAPIIHRVEPESEDVWYIERIILNMTHTAAGADNLFGDQAALLNGVVLRGYVDGMFGSLTNWKSNQDIKLDMFDLVYTDKAGGPGGFGTSGRGSFSRIDVSVRLDGRKGDFMDLLVQDDLTGLSSFFINAQGYIEDD